MITNEELTSRPKVVGHTIRVLESTFKKRFMKEGEACGLDEVTMMHGWILGYLNCNTHRDIYQKTLETDCHMTRSTVTTVLQLMEKKGYITRVAVPTDARLKKIVLTPLGVETALKSKKILDSMEEVIKNGVSQEEMETFYSIADRIIQNLKCDQEEMKNA